MGHIDDRLMQHFEQLTGHLISFTKMFLMIIF